MIVLKTAVQLSAYLQEQKKTGKSIGFVPTMGALHDGHLSLISQAKQETSLTACSIFVNPTQFNNKEDFNFYPKTIEKDLEQLAQVQCHVLFLPAETEMYPPGTQLHSYDLGSLEHTLEGRHRPGHFQGVCQAVGRLLDFIEPDVLYMGQKDYQQCLVVDRLLTLTGRNNLVRLQVCPTVREKDGLAMSSRNLRLDHTQRLQAAGIYRVLSAIKESLGMDSLAGLKQSARQQLQSQGFVVDYVEIAHAKTLAPAQSLHEPLVALVAASLGNIRLIDNMLLN